MSKEQELKEMLKLYSKQDLWNRIQEKQAMIYDLEAKLADSEKQIKDARETANMSVDSWCKNRRKYEAQIAEMQNKSFILYSMLYETLEKQGCDNVASQIDQMTGWTYDKEADWLKGNRNYDQLKQQLAEKEKQLENAQNLKAIEVADELSLKLSKIHNQDKISFAIDKLEKVKGLIANHTQELWTCENDYIDVVLYKEIDNQIVELKKEMK